MKSKGKKVKRHHIIIKTVWQVLVYLLEILLIAGGLTQLSIISLPVQNWFEWVERFTVIFALYQVTVYMILNNLNDIERDSFIALRANYENALLYCQTNDERIRDALDKNINYQLDAGTSNTIKARSEYEIMKQLIANRDTAMIQYRISMIGAAIEYTTLNWRYSFLLRILK